MKPLRHLLFALPALTAALLGSRALAASAPSPAPAADPLLIARTSFANPPLAFEALDPDSSPAPRFLSRSRSGLVCIHDHAATLTLVKATADSDVSYSRGE